MFQAEAGMGKAARVSRTREAIRVIVSSMPYPVKKGQEKGSGQLAMNRSKQGRMAIKAVALLVGLVIGSIQFAEAQQTKVYRIGVLTLHTHDRPHLQGLRNGLKKAGYIEGKNLVLKMMSAKNAEELRSIAKDHAEEKMDIVVTTGNVETIVARAVWVLPIIFMPGGEPVRSGFVKSLARPGVNITGVSLLGDSKIYGKELELFKDVVPNLQRVLMFYDSGEEVIPDISLPLVRKVAAHLAIKLFEKPVQSLAQAEQEIAVASKNTTDGVFFVCTSVFSDFKRIAEYARKKKIPSNGCSSRAVAEDQALLSYRPDLYQIGHRGAWYVNEILKGAKPAELPVEHAARFELVINLKTANQIGLTISPNVLAIADRVIK
jgi:putative tryptophan/tyrosine transport system substrate-binding protein